MKIKKCFAVNSYYEFELFIEKKKLKDEIIVVYIKYYLIKGLGINWLNDLITQIKKNYKKLSIKFFIDSGNDYGLSIQIIRENVDYLKLSSNESILSKISQIAKKNKVLLNPNFHVVDISRSLRKNYEN